MPEKETIRRARRDQREGKAPSTQAGEFIREEFHHVREGKHGARSPEQLIAIGLSKARRSGVKLGTPKRGRVSAESRERIASDERRARSGTKRKPSPRRSRAMLAKLKREGTSAASPRAAAAHARRAARRRSPAERRASAKKAARTRARTRTAHRRVSAAR